VVRRFVASALLRTEDLPDLELTTLLLAHGKDAADHNLPLLYWYVAEPFLERNPRTGVILLSACKIPLVSGFIVRRLAQIGTPEALETVLKQLPADDDGRKLFLRELAGGLEGRKQVPMPESWSTAFEILLKSPDPALADAARGLALTFGDQAMIAQLETTLLDEKLPPDRREAALAALVKARIDGVAPKVRTLLATPALRGAALRALSTYDDPATPTDVLAIYGQLGDAEKRDAISTLGSRLPYAQKLLDAVEAKTVASTDLSADLVRQLRNFKNPELDKRIKEVWGTLNDTPEERKRLITKYRDLIRAAGERPDVALGRAVFAKTCSQCHTLFGSGGKVGPEITGANRTNLDYVLSNIVDPSALIGKDYVAHVIELADGRVLTGLIRNETPTALSIITATETVVLSKSDVETREPSAKSMMPEDILKPLSDKEVRSLVAYLAAPAQVPLAATPENAKTFFNGRDLAGWSGKPELWSVENGEIVGRTEGLKQNEFLVSDLTAGDFRLTLEVKLSENKGNSGIQVRSEPLPGGSVRGYQADVGVGWWGKLYEEHGRGLLWPASGESHVKTGDWNRYEIVCVGSRIRTLLNGKPCVDLADPAGRKNGIFAFQLHSGGPTEVRYRNLKLELDPKWDFSPIAP
jgi:putative heme-binding domain-containing protein